MTSPLKIILPSLTTPVLVLVAPMSKPIAVGVLMTLNILVRLCSWKIETYSVYYFVILPFEQGQIHQQVPRGLLASAEIAIGSFFSITLSCIEWPEDQALLGSWPST